MKVKLSVWQQVSLVVSIATLIGFIITPIFAARADMDQFWKGKMNRVQNDYKRNVKNIRYLRNYSIMDIEYEREKLNARKETVLQDRVKIGGLMEQKLLKKYYAYGLMRWIFFIGLFYVIGVWGPVLMRRMWSAFGNSYPSAEERIMQLKSRIRSVALEVN